MAPRDNRSIHDFLSWPGLITVGIGYGFYWLSERAGRNAQELEKVPRIDLSDLRKKKQNELPCIASVTGRVSSKTPLQCQNVPERGVIHRFITKEVFMKKNDRGEWKQDHKTISDFTRETKWYLSKCADKGVKLHVENGKSASGLELKIVYEGFDSGSGDGSKTALGALENLLRAGSDMWNGMKSIGTLQKEGLLPLGSTVTAVGQVSKSYVDKNDFVIQRPGKGGPFYISTKSMPELVQSLSRSSKRWWYLGLGFTSVGLFFFLRKIYLRVLESSRLKQLRKDIEEYLDRKQAEGEDVPEREDICVVCMEKPYDSVFIKCGHMCTCLSCGERAKKCPVCREVSKVKYVYKA